MDQSLNAADLEPAVRPEPPGWRRLHRLSWLIGPVLLVLVWDGVYRLQLFTPTLLPGPVASFTEAFELLSTGDIVPDIVETLWRTMLGYLSACLIGMLLGLAIGSFRSLYVSLEFLIDFFRSLPVTTLYPIFVLFFGIGSGSKIAMVFAASVFVVTLNSAYGVLRASPVRREMARLYGASRAKILWSVTLPEALPQTLIGMRVALSYSLIVAIVTEMFMGTQIGLGQRVFDAYTKYATAELYAVVLITGVLGYLLNQCFVWGERRLVGWASR